MHPFAPLSAQLWVRWDVESAHDLHSSRPDIHHYLGPRKRYPNKGAQTVILLSTLINHDLEVCFMSFFPHPITLSILIRSVGRWKPCWLGWCSSFLQGNSTRKGLFDETKIQRPCDSKYCAASNLWMQTIYLEWREERGNRKFAYPGISQLEKPEQMVKLWSTMKRDTTCQATTKGPNCPNLLLMAKYHSISYYITILYLNMTYIYIE